MSKCTVQVVRCCYVRLPSRSVNMHRERMHSGTAFPRRKGDVDQRWNSASSSMTLLLESRREKYVSMCGGALYQAPILSDRARQRKRAQSRSYFMQGTTCIMSVRAVATSLLHRNYASGLQVPGVRTEHLLIEALPSHPMPGSPPQQDRPSEAYTNAKRLIVSR
jgi:hypothetical protein